MKWQELIERKGKFKISSIEKMFSRRNDVFLITADSPLGPINRYVLKIHRDSRADQEAYILNALLQAGIAVPRIIWSDSQYILMQYINGVLLEQIILQDEDPAQAWIEKLAQWLVSLHLFLVKDGHVSCMPDLNLRNFIFSGGEFYGLDFEEFRFDKPERDLGGLSAYILNNHPMFTPQKWMLVRHLVNTYIKEAAKVSGIVIDRELISSFFYREMAAAAVRRQDQKLYLIKKIDELQGKCLF